MDDPTLTREIIIFWRIGVSLSSICFIMQVLIYIFVPCSRKLDLKILTQITVARLLNVIFEYLIATLPPFLTGLTFDVTLALYIHSDCALICWMFVFSKNLYDKVTIVFLKKRITFLVTSLLLWILTLPVGILAPVTLFINPDYFDVFYKVYVISKFVILSVNLLFFCRIFYVIIRTKSGDLKGILKIGVISFILVSIASIQVFLTDLVSFFEQDALLLVFSVINSYQIFAVMAIFVILVRGSLKRNIKSVDTSASVKVKNTYTNVA